MAFTLQMTGTPDVPDSIRQEYDTEFMLALAEQGVGSQLATVKRDIGAKNITIDKYDHLGLAVTPLVEDEDVESEKLVTSGVIITPKEFGKVVTTTKLSNLQTGGKVDRAAARLVGINAGRSTNKLSLLTMDASTNRIYSDGAGTATIDAGDIMTSTLMGKVYNKLSRANALGIQGNDYVMVAHDDVIHDIREGSGANSWIDAHKYALPEQLLRNEVGMYKGFRVIRDNLSTIQIDAGVGAVDVYNTYFVGFNALGYGESNGIEMRATGPFDKLGRFINMGWYGVYDYEIVEQDALWVVESSSSVGVNV